MGCGRATGRAAGGRWPGLAAGARGSVLVPVCGGDAAARVLDRADADAVLAGATASRAGSGPADAALLSAVSMCFALGAATTEQFKHLAAAEAGPLAGLGALPGLRRCGRGWRRSPTAADPLAVQAPVRVRDAGRGPGDLRGCTTSMTTSSPIPAQPVAKGWNNKRGTGGTGRADTHVTAHNGRAVCFVTGEPSGLSRPCRRRWPS